MITEDYVSYEVARLLQEKGFDEKCPTLQMAMKWLRVVHKIDICAFPVEYDYITSGYSCCIYKDKKPVVSSEEFKSYEKAVETACIYVLKNLI